MRNRGLLFLSFLSLWTSACGSDPATPDAGDDDDDVDAAPVDPDAMPDEPDAMPVPPDATPPDAVPPDAVPPDAMISMPAVSTLTPTSGSTTGGAAITVTGTDFQTGATVTIDGLAATVTAVTATELTFTLPANAGRAALVDVVVTNPDGGTVTADDAFRYYYGTIAFATHVDHTTADEPRGILAVDLDHDNDLDLATSHRTGGVIAVNLNNGAGVFGATTTNVVGALATGVAAGDWNNDTHVDLATMTVTGGGLSFLYGTGTGTFGTYDPNNPAHRRAVVDLLRIAGGQLDNALAADIALGFRNAGRGIATLLANPAGAGFTQTSTLASTQQITSLTTGHVDGDANLDIVGGSVNLIVVARGAGSGTLLPLVEYPLGATSSPGAVTTADLDGDGDRDIVAAINGTAGLSLLLNNGDGTFATAVTMTTPGNFSGGVAAVDVDRDGRLDLVFSNSNNDTVSVMRNVGGVTYASGFEFATGDRPIELVTGDFNADGRVDLAVQLDTADGFSVLLGASQ